MIDFMMELRDLAEHAEELINYAFGEPTVTLSKKNALAIANEIERLTHEVERLQLAWENQCSAFQTIGKEYKADVDRLRAALEWYAHPLHGVKGDAGQRAREALRGVTREIHDEH